MLAVVGAVNVRRPRHDVRDLRREAADAQGWRCGRCGCAMIPDPGERASVSADHLIPRRAGGKTAPHNIVALCVPCNKRKADTITAADLMLAARRYIAARNGTQMPKATNIPDRAPDLISDGTLEFQRDDQPGSPSVLIPAGVPIWFVPFTDAEIADMGVTREELTADSPIGDTGAVWDWPGEPEWAHG